MAAAWARWLVAAPANMTKAAAAAAAAAGVRVLAVHGSLVWPRLECSGVSVPTRQGRTEVLSSGTP
eukprot:364568-Chlamydomonas_euryale.AAC.10